jgi:hypothetical protein
MDQRMLARSYGGFSFNAANAVGSQILLTGQSAFPHFNPLDLILGD